MQRLIKGYILSFFATIIWSSAACMMLKVVALDSFRLETYIMLIAAIVLISYGIITKQAEIKHFSFWGLLGIPVNQICYLLAIKLIPVPMADFLYSLWPVIILVNSGRLGIRENLAILMAVISMVLIYQPSLSQNAHYLIGIPLVLSGAFCWSLYITKVKEKSIFLLGVYLMLGSIITFFLSCLYENNVATISQYDLIYIILLGLGPSALAYVLWQNALNFAPVLHISWITLLMPVISYTMLIMAGLFTFNTSILAALILIITSNLIIAT